MTRSGASVAPIDAPDPYMPTASPRSLGGNHSATTLGDAVYPPASPSPRKKRQIPSPAIDCVSPVNIWAMDHPPANNARLRRDPSASTIRPETRYEIV